PGDRHRLAREVDVVLEASTTFTRAALKHTASFDVGTSVAMLSNAAGLANSAYFLGASQAIDPLIDAHLALARLHAGRCDLPSAITSYMGAIAAVQTAVSRKPDDLHLLSREFRVVLEAITAFTRAAVKHAASFDTDSSRARFKEVRILLRRARMLFK